MPIDNDLGIIDVTPVTDTNDLFKGANRLGIISLASTSNLNVFLEGVPFSENPEADVDLRVYADTDNNGELDYSIDQLIGSSVRVGNGLDESINLESVAAGRYIVEPLMSSDGSVNMNLRLSTAAPSNLLPTEIEVGTLNDTQTFTDIVSSTDTTDTYHFSVDAASNFSLSLSGLSADTNVLVQLIQDTDGDLVVAPSEVIASSTADSTTPSSLNALLNPGDNYFVQVNKLSGDTNYTISLTTDVSQGQSTQSDFNSDGQTDILWRNTVTGDNYVWLMDGTNIISGASITALDTSWDIGGTSDFNSDGQTDILWRNTLTGDNSVWLMDGTNIISGASIAAVDTSWDIGGTSDFNSDGQTDILWRNTLTGDNSVWLMDGTNIISGVSIAAVDTSWDVGSTSDFNSDGQTDILWRNTVTGDNYVWLMDGTNIISGVSIAAVDLSWTVGGTSDFNSDGQTDILWRNTLTGENSVWLMDGTNLISGVSIASLPDTTWGIFNT